MARPDAAEGRPPLPPSKQAQAKNTAPPKIAGRVSWGYRRGEQARGGRVRDAVTAVIRIVKVNLAVSLPAKLKSLAG